MPSCFLNTSPAPPSTLPCLQICWLSWTATARKPVRTAACYLPKALGCCCVSARKALQPKLKKAGRPTAFAICESNPKIKSSAGEKRAFGCVWLVLAADKQGICNFSPASLGELKVQIQPYQVII